MKVGDSRVRGGPGILPLQHEGFEADKWPLWNRASVLGIRITGRADNQGGRGPDGSQDLGHWIEDPETRGDVMGGSFWQRTSRPIGGWRFSWPSVTTDEEGTGGPAASGNQARPGQAPSKANQPKPAKEDAKPPAPGNGSGCAVQEDPKLLPVLSSEWDPDDRFETIDYTRPEVWPKFPKEWYGITLAADQENEQEDLFYPCDPRMIAVHCHGDKEMGSLVGDMASGFELDPDRMARLQSVFKVARKPAGCGFTSPGNTIAWNVGETGCKDSRGGLIWQKGKMQPVMILTGPGGGGGGGGRVVPVPQASPTVSISGCPEGRYGHVAQKHSGPWDLDCTKHEIAKDADGNQVFPVHLSLNSYFTFPGGLFDGPLKYDGNAEIGEEAPYVVDVRFGFDPRLDHPFVCGSRKGKHRWWSYAYRYIPEPPTIITPPGVPEVPFRIPEEEDPVLTDPVPRQWDPERFDPFIPSPYEGKRTVVRPYDRSDGFLTFPATMMEEAGACYLFRPQMIGGSTTNYLNWKTPDQKEIAETIDQRTPITGRFEAWGAQGEKTGSTYLGSAFGWDYTHDPGTYRYGGGTADGGICILPPEVSLSDIDNDLTPSTAGVSTSSTTLLAGPGAALGVGLPDLEAGGVSLGYTLSDDAGDLRFKSNASSSGTNRVVFEAGGNVGIGIDNAANLLHIKDSATSSVDEDMLCIESAGNSTGDSWGLKFLNASGNQARIRCLQASTGATDGELRFGTASGGTIDLTTIMDASGAWSYQTALTDEVFAIDPGNWRVGPGASTGVNLAWNTLQFGGGEGVIALGNASTVPASTPSGGGVIYTEGGALKYKGSSGTVTTIASA